MLIDITVSRRSGLASGLKLKLSLSSVRKMEFPYYAGGDK